MCTTIFFYFGTDLIKIEIWKYEIKTREKLIKNRNLSLLLPFSFHISAEVKPHSSCIRCFHRKPRMMTLCNATFEPADKWWASNKTLNFGYGISMLPMKLLMFDWVIAKQWERERMSGKMINWILIWVCARASIRILTDHIANVKWRLIRAVRSRSAALTHSERWH